MMKKRFCSSFGGLGDKFSTSVLLLGSELSTLTNRCKIIFSSFCSELCFVLERPRYIQAASASSNSPNLKLGLPCKKNKFPVSKGKKPRAKKFDLLTNFFLIKINIFYETKLNLISHLILVIQC